MRMSLRTVLRGLLLISILLNSFTVLAAQRTCAVCDRSLGSPVAQRSVQGREVFVHPDCAAAFAENPALYASKVAPWSAGVPGADAAPAGTSPWLYLGIGLGLAGSAVALLVLRRSRRVAHG